MKGTACSPRWKPSANGCTTTGKTSTMPLREVAQHTVFTTHTPVPAGHDRFDGGLIEEHLGPDARCFGHFPSTIDGLGARGTAQRRRKFLHDRAGPKAFPPRQCRECSAWACVAPHVGTLVAVASGRRNSDRPHYQRRTRAVLAGVANAAVVRPHFHCRLDAAHGQARNIWQEIYRCDPANCGKPITR